MLASLSNLHSGPRSLMYWEEHKLWHHKTPGFAAWPSLFMDILQIWTMCCLDMLCNHSEPQFPRVHNADNKAFLPGLL